MGTDNPTSKFSTEALTALASRLVDAADATLARKDTERDLTTASIAIERFGSRIKPGTPNIQPSTCASVRSDGNTSGLRNAARLPSRSARESQAAML